MLIVRPFEDRVYVPNNAEIRKLILQEAHDSPYSIHPENTKMYLDLKERFWLRESWIRGYPDSRVISFGRTVGL